MCRDPECRRKTIGNEVCAEVVRETVLVREAACQARDLATRLVHGDRVSPAAELTGRQQPGEPGPDHCYMARAGHGRPSWRTNTASSQPERKPRPDAASATAANGAAITVACRAWRLIHSGADQSTRKLATDRFHAGG